MGGGYLKFVSDEKLVQQRPPGVHALECKNAVKSELSSFVKNGAISTPMDLPPGKIAHKMHLLMTAKAPDSKYPNGRRKCRIVVNGRTMEPYHDYNPESIFSGVADKTGHRICFGWANEIGAPIIKACDISVAFLSVKLRDDEEVYLYPCEGMCFWL